MDEQRYCSAHQKWAILPRVLNLWWKWEWVFAAKNSTMQFEQRLQLGRQQKASWDAEAIKFWKVPRKLFSNCMTMCPPMTLFSLSGILGQASPCIHCLCSRLQRCAWAVLTGWPFPTPDTPKHKVAQNLSGCTCSKEWFENCEILHNIVPPRSERLMHECLRGACFRGIYSRRKALKAVCEKKGIKMTFSWLVERSSHRGRGQNAKCCSICPCAYRSRLPAVVLLQWGTEREDATIWVVLDGSSQGATAWSCQWWHRSFAVQRQYPGSERLDGKVNPFRDMAWQTLHRQILDVLGSLSCLTRSSNWEAYLTSWIAAQVNWSTNFSSHAVAHVPAWMNDPSVLCCHSWLQMQLHCSKLLRHRRVDTSAADIALMWLMKVMSIWMRNTRKSSRVRRNLAPPDSSAIQVRWKTLVSMWRRSWNDAINIEHMPSVGCDMLTLWPGSCSKSSQSEDVETWEGFSDAASLLPLYNHLAVGSSTYICLDSWNSHASVYSGFSASIAKVLSSARPHCQDSVTECCFTSWPLFRKEQVKLLSHSPMKCVTWDPLSVNHSILAAR